MVIPLFEIALGLVLIVIAILIIAFMKNFLANAVAGVIALLVISILADYAKYPLIKIPITIVTVLISGLLGLAGVGLLILLKLLGINIS